jgi:hypothetical protein
MRIGVFPEREEILIHVAGFPQERVSLNTHSKFRRSFKAKRKFVVPGGGVEPPRPEGRRILRARLGFLQVTDSFQNHSPSKVWNTLSCSFVRVRVVRLSTL